MAINSTLTMGVITTYFISNSIRKKDTLQSENGVQVMETIKYGQEGQAYYV